MPRILFIGDHLGYADGVLHGGTVYALHVFPALVRAGCAVECCFLGREHRSASVLREGGVSVKFLGAGKWNPMAAAQLLREARSFRPDVVHVSGQKSSLLGRMAARLTGAPAVVHVHDLVPVPAAMRIAYRLVASSRDIGVAVSGAVRSHMARDYGLSLAQSRVIWNGLDDRWAALRPEREPRPSPADVVLTVGRFYSAKGHALLIDMMPALLQRFPALKFRFAGDGPLLEDCRAQARALGVAANVEFLGQRDDIPALIEQATLVAIPSPSEGLSTAALEAATIGRTVVAFDCGGTSEAVLNGKTGLLAPPGDSAAFVEALSHLLSDTQLRLEMERAAIEHSRQFTLERHVASLLKVYLEMSRG
jgi:glycosyltransferase involved in cell wall biosynthesis